MGIKQLPTSLNWWVDPGFLVAFNSTIGSTLPPPQHLHGFHHFPCRTGRWWQLGGHLGWGYQLRERLVVEIPWFTGFQNKSQVVTVAGFRDIINSVSSVGRNMCFLILFQSRLASEAGPNIFLTVCHPSSTRWVLQPVTPPITRTPGRAFLGKIPIQRS